jgi:hypothetical protein
MTRPADVMALRRKRCEAARRADELVDLFDKYPSVEIKTEMDLWCREVDAFDRAIAECST